MRERERDKRAFDAMRDSIHFASRCSACTPRQSSTSCAVDPSLCSPSRRRCSRSIDCSWSLKSYHCDRIVRIMRLSVTFWSVLLALLFCIWGAWFALQLVLLLLLATGASGCLSAHLMWRCFSKWRACGVAITWALSTFVYERVLLNAVPQQAAVLVTGTSSGTSEAPHSLDAFQPPHSDYLSCRIRSVVRA